MANNSNLSSFSISPQRKSFHKSSDFEEAKENNLPSSNTVVFKNPANANEEVITTRKVLIYILDTFNLNKYIKVPHSENSDDSDTSSNNSEKSSDQSRNSFFDTDDSFIKQMYSSSGLKRVTSTNFHTNVKDIFYL